MLSNKKETQTPVRKIETREGSLDLWGICRWTRAELEPAYKKQDMRLRDILNDTIFDTMKITLQQVNWISWENLVVHKMRRILKVGRKFLY